MVFGSFFGASRTITSTPQFGAKKKVIVVDNEAYFQNTHTGLVYRAAKALGIPEDKIRIHKYDTTGNKAIVKPTGGLSIQDPRGKLAKDEDGLKILVLNDKSQTVSKVEKAAANKTPFQAIFSDNDMPNLTLAPAQRGQGTDEGLATFAEIQQNPLITPKPKFFMITGNTNMDTLKERASAIGLPPEQILDKQKQGFKPSTAQTTLRQAFGD